VLEILVLSVQRFGIVLEAARKVSKMINNLVDNDYYKTQEMRDNIIIVEALASHHYLLLEEYGQQDGSRILKVALDFVIVI
jgi:hypothetical protein